MLNERIERVLDAAYASFARHGVKRTTMDDIAREAGMSRGAVYQYVRNKDDAYRQVAGRLFGQSLTLAEAGIGMDGDLAERLIAALTAKLDLTLRIRRDSPHAAELLGAGARLTSDLEAEYTTALCDLLAEAITAQRPDVDATELAELLLALTRGLEADLSDPSVPVRRLRRGVTLLVAGLPRTPTKELS
jgi:AcrR family transcriptional regulator